MGLHGWENAYKNWITLPIWTRCVLFLVPHFKIVLLLSVFDLQFFEGWHYGKLAKSVRVKTKCAKRTRVGLWGQLTIRKSSMSITLSYSKDFGNKFLNRKTINYDSTSFLYLFLSLSNSTTSGFWNQHLIMSEKISIIIIIIMTTRCDNERGGVNCPLIFARINYDHCKYKIRMFFILNLYVVCNVVKESYVLPLKEDGVTPIFWKDYSKEQKEKIFF
jgi:hypothetical protein